MGDHRVLLVESAARISVRDGCLRLRRDGHEDAFVLPEDIAVMVLHHPAISLSAQVLQRLSHAGGAVLITDDKHLPSAMLWPWRGQERMAGRLRQQMDLDRDTIRRDTLWGEIVRTRLATQALNLRHFRMTGALRLERLSSRVQPGDPDNLEAQGTRHYWKSLFPADFARRKKGADDPVNVRLNFGYAVLRSLVARSLAAVGLQPALGLGHHSRENAFNLADDFLEPYRFLVERQVRASDPETPFDAAARTAVLDFVAADVTFADRAYRLPSAVTESVASFVRILDGKTESLALPAMPCRSTVGE
ncbi:MAG TPA: type II CRISPR-associated endonuclease Cas1 [Gemmatimonadales bacterium]|jgi:CRISPR-associated protein Cas1